MIANRRNPTMDRYAVWLAIVPIALCFCKPENISVPKPSYLAEVTRRDGGLTLRLRVAQNNAMASVLILENRSSVPVTLYRKNLSLAIGDLAVAHPVGDYSRYVYKRLRTAKKVCDKKENLLDCRQTITEYFMPYISAHPFRFGTIKPNETREGVIAFDLLDPFSILKKNARLKRALKKAPEKIAVTITIKPTSRVGPAPFRFLIFAEPVQDTAEKAFGLLRFYR
jgi:hypothetical protein